MTTLRVARYLAVASLFTAWGCTTSHFVTNNYGVDDLYGDTGSPVKVAQNRQNESIANSRNGNPDFQYAEGGSTEVAEGADYYDDTYLSVRNLRRNVSENVGYGSGFDDGYYAGRNAAGWNPYFASAMWPSLGFASSRYFGMNMGFGNPFRYGYNPWGYSSFGYSPYSSWGDPYWGGSGFYSPFYSGMGFGYGGGYYGGYSPWNAYPIVVINNGDTRSTRTYGPRGAQSGARGAQSVAGVSNVSPRRGSTAPSANVDGSSRRGGSSFYGGRSATGNAAASNGAYYSAPRGGSPSYVNTAPNIRSSASSVNSRSGRSSDGAYYYSQPRSTGRSLSNGNAGQATRSSYEGNSGSSRSPSYNNSNSSSRPSAPTYSAPTRSSTPSYSAPSRSGSSGGSAPSYSAPSRGGGGGGSSSRGPR